MPSTPDPSDDAGALRQRLSEAQAKADRLDLWLDVLVDESPAGMGVISALENRYVRANQAMADICGLSLEEILDSDPFTMAMRLTHPDDLAAEQKLFAELVAGTRRSYRVEKRYVRPDGSFRWGLLTFSGIFEGPGGSPAPGRALRYVVVQIVDVTDAKALAETLQRREAELRHAQRIDGIGRLAAGIAHDFNNMLTVVMGHGEVLERRIREGGSCGPDLRDNVEAILAAAERAASLTAQLLAYGRQGPVAPRTIVLSEAVEKLQRLLARTLGSNVRVEQSLKATGSVFADEGQVGQVVMNLVLNARDALPEGGRIRVSTKDVAAGAPPGAGEWVALAVSDTGHGMRPEVKARMFEPFFTTRGDRPGTQGTGLGLATVQRIVADSGGRIDVESAVGEGTTVTVFFPRVAAAPKDVDAPRALRQPEDSPSGRRILVIDDEPSVRALIGQVLMGARYWVAVARDGEEALRFVEAEREPFHLVVSDLVMPSVGGASLAKRLHERANPPRMLFVSGHSDHTPAELLPYGQLLAKPFTPSQLLAAVARALDEPA